MRDFNHHESLSLQAPPAETSQAGSDQHYEATTRPTEAGFLLARVQEKLANVSRGGRRRLAMSTAAGAILVGALTGCGDKASAETETGAGAPNNKPQVSAGQEVEMQSQWESWIATNPGLADCDTATNWDEHPDGSVTLTPIISNKSELNGSNLSTVVFIGERPSSVEDTNAFARSYVQPGEAAAVTIPSQDMNKLKSFEVGSLTMAVVNTPDVLEASTSNLDATFTIYEDAMGVKLPRENGRIVAFGENAETYNKVREASNRYAGLCYQEIFATGEPSNITVGSQIG